MNLDDISTDDDADLTSSNDQGGLIIPKQTCEHIQQVHLIERIDAHMNNICIDCDDSDENWLCLTCGEIHCSRYVNNHGEGHWLFTLLTDEHFDIGHCLTLSLRDLSVWCYSCNAYIRNIRLDPLIKQIETIRFTLTSTETFTRQLSSLNNLVESTTGPMVEIISPSTVIAIQESSLLIELETSNLLSDCCTIKPRLASIEELVRIHSSDYVNMVALTEKNHTARDQFKQSGLTIKCTDLTFHDARLSAGTIIDVFQYLVHNHVKNGFVLISSPGHRAARDHGVATSIFNNVALGIDSILLDRSAETKTRTPSLALFGSNTHLHMEGASPIEDAICHMINVLTPSSDRRASSVVAPVKLPAKDDEKRIIERVFVLDLTREHGSGIQSIFYESRQVFVVSIHEQHHRHKSSHHECGKDDGRGFNMNIPWLPSKTIGDNEYVSCLKELILPIIHEFEPELIVLCVDFQIEHLTSQCYAWIIEQLMIVNEHSQLAVVLDGDLSTSLSSKSPLIQTILRLLLGKEASSSSEQQWEPSLSIDPLARRTLDLVKQEHKQFWSCL